MLVLLFGFGGGIWCLSSVSWSFWCSLYDAKRALEVFSSSEMGCKLVFAWGDGSPTLSLAREGRRSARMMVVYGHLWRLTAEFPRFRPSLLCFLIVPPMGDGGLPSGGGLCSSLFSLCWHWREVFTVTEIAVWSSTRQMSGFWGFISLEFLVSTFGSLAHPGALVLTWSPEECVWLSCAGRVNSSWGMLIISGPMFVSFGVGGGCIVRAFDVSLMWYVAALPLSMSWSY